MAVAMQFKDYATKVPSPLPAADPNTLPIEKVVQLMIDALFSSCQNMSIKRSLSEKYTKLEPLLREQANKLEAFDPTGGLRWTMSWTEVQSYVRQKFQEMRKKGSLLFRSEFEKQEDVKKFRTLGHIRSPNQRSVELTRVWGAEYLRKELEKKGSTEPHSYRIPRFIVVVEDHVKQFPVSLVYYTAQGVTDLCIHSMNQEDGEILVENIENGIPVGKLGALFHSVLHSVGYSDFGDLGDGNILQKDDHYYVVDTELKSFEGASKDRSWNMNCDGIEEIHRYAAKRFEVFCHFPCWDRRLITVEMNEKKSVTAAS